MKSVTARRAELSWGAMLAALRRWWPVVVLAALVGGLAGGVSAMRSEPTASSTLILQVDAVDSARLSREVQAALSRASDSAVYTEAAQELGMSVAELRTHSSLQAQNDSLTIVVSGHAPTSERAVEIANAISEAAVSGARQDVQSQLRDLETATQQLIKVKSLSDAAAETARVTRLGEGLANNQTQVVALSNKLRLQEAASPETVRRGSPLNNVIMGGLSGLLLSGIGVALLGQRRGRVRRESELSTLYPDAIVTTPAELQDMSRDDSSSVLHLVVASDEVATVSPRLAELLGQHGAGAGSAAFDVAVMRPDNPDFRRAMRDPNTAVVFPVVLGATTISHLDAMTKRVRSGLALLAMEEDLLHEPAAPAAH